MTETINGSVNRGRTAAATEAGMRRKTLRLVNELGDGRLRLLGDEELTGLLLLVFDETARRAQAYAVGRRP